MTGKFSTFSHLCQYFLLPLLFYQRNARIKRFSGMTGKRLSPIAILHIHKNKDVDD